MVEWDGFENRCTGNGTGGSNPSLSADKVGQNTTKVRQILQYQRIVGFFIVFCPG